MRYFKKKFFFVYAHIWIHFFFYLSRTLFTSRRQKVSASVWPTTVIFHFVIQAYYSTRTTQKKKCSPKNYQHKYWLTTSSLSEHRSEMDLFFFPPASSEPHRTSLPSSAIGSCHFTSHPRQQDALTAPCMRRREEKLAESGAQAVASKRAALSHVRCQRPAAGAE